MKNQLNDVNRRVDIAWASSLPKVDMSVYSQMNESIQTVSKTMKSMIDGNEAMLESARKIANTCGQYSDWAREVSASMQRSLTFAREIAQGWAGLAPRIDLSDTIASIRRITDALSDLSYTGKLSRANWPLYLVDNVDLLRAICDLDPSLDDEQLSDEIARLAFCYLDKEWADGIAASWGVHAELGAGRLTLLNSALLRYENADYEGCVCILACMLEGLLDFYYVGPKRLTGEEARAYADYARRLGIVRPIRDGEVSLRATKDQVVMLLMSSKGARKIWESAVSYLLGVALTNVDDASLAAHNPLRNKICHGVQTAYGTKEHALKSILVTDIVLELGRLSRLGEGSCNEGLAGGQIRFE